MNFFLLLLLALASGCATRHLLPPHAISPQLHALQHLEHWEVQGKIIFQSPIQKNRATFTWRQNREQFFIQLRHPLGMHSVTLFGTPDYAEFRESTGKKWETQNPQALLQQKWGILLPIKDLSYWIRGVPTQNCLQNSLQWNTENLISHFKQDDWVVHYQHYQSQGPWTLPAKLHLTHSHFTIQIIIHKWALIDKKPVLLHN